MTHGGKVLIGIGLAVTLLALSGCLSTDTGFDTPTTPSTSSTTLQDREDLIAALKKTHASRYKLAVEADLGKDGKVTATGAADSAARLFGNTVKHTGTTLPTSIERVIVGNDAYLRDLDGKSGRWMHVNLARFAKTSLNYVDTTDPVGLAKFIDSVGSVERGSTPGAYLGKFNANNAGNLPIGAPLETCLCSHLMPFRAVVDAQGRVASISMELVLTDSPTMKMTTTFSDFDAPVHLAPPPKAKTVEAPDWYYDSPTPSPSK